MRIGMVCYPTYGGSGVVAAELGMHLAERGHVVHFMSFDLPFRLEKGFQRNVSFHPVDLSTYHVLLTQPYTLTLATKIAEVVTQENLDIVHVHYAVPHSISALLARHIIAQDFKIVTTLHGTDITLIGEMPSYKPVVKLAIEQSDAVTCVSHWLKDRTKDCIRPEKDLHVIYNFIDVDAFKPISEKERTKSALWQRDQRILMHASNFRPLKRVQDIIRAFALIQERVACRLVLIGDGPEHEHAVQLAKELGVFRKVDVIGKINEPEKFFPHADLFLMASEVESFGLSPAEAMSSGVPVIGTRVGGLCEVIDDGVNGVLVPVGDYEALAQKAIEVLQNPALHQSMKEKAREKIVRAFSPDKIVSQYEILYSKTLGLDKHTEPAG